MYVFLEPAQHGAECQPPCMMAQPSLPILVRRKHSCGPEEARLSPADGLRKTKGRGEKKLNEKENERVGQRPHHLTVTGLHAAKRNSCVCPRRPWTNVHGSTAPNGSTGNNLLDVHGPEKGCINGRIFTQWNVIQKLSEWTAATYSNMDGSWNIIGSGKGQPQKAACRKTPFLQTQEQTKLNSILSNNVYVPNKTYFKIPSPSLLGKWDFWGEDLGAWMRGTQRGRWVMLFFSC